MTQWYLAKYMPDLRRREPRNVGVILFTGGLCLSRFLGEDTQDPEKIDGRTVRHKVGSTDNYRDWIHFWRASAAKGPDELPVRRSADNYYLEPGGQQLAGSAVDPEVLLARLYAQLVSEDEEPEELTDRSDAVVQLFESVKPTLTFTQNYVVDLNYDEHTFDYAVPADGRLLLFRHVVLNGNSKKTWDAVHTAAFAVREVTEASPTLVNKPEPYVIVSKRDAGPFAPKQMRALEHKVGDRLRRTEGIDADRHWLLGLAKVSLPSS